MRRPSLSRRASRLTCITGKFRTLTLCYNHCSNRCWPAAAPAGAPNVVVFVLSTQRRDQWSAYGGPNEAIEAEPELLANFRKHTGLYVYRREYLLEFTKLPRTRLEKIEMLEQLRALENGAKIKVIEAVTKSIGVDTEEDLELVRQMLEEQGRAALPDLS